MCGMRRAESGEDPAPLLRRVFLPRQSLRDPAVLSPVEVGGLTIAERQLHRPGHHPHVLCFRHGRQVVGRDDLEHLGQRRATGGRRAVGIHGPCTVPDAHRFPEDGHVLGEILFRYHTAHLEHVAAELARQLPLVEDPPPPLSDRLEGVGEIGEPHLFTLQIHPLPVVEVFAGLVGEPQHLLGDPEPEGRSLAHPEPLTREPDRGSKRLFQAQPAVPLQKRLPSPQGPWDGGRCPADYGAHPGPVLEDHRLRAATGPKGRSRQPLAWHHVVVIDELGFPRRIPDEGEPTAPDRTHQRFGNANCGRRGYGRIRGVTPRQVRLGGGLGRIRSTRGNGEGAVGACSLHNWLLCTVFTVSCRPGPQHTYSKGDTAYAGQSYIPPDIVVYRSYCCHVAATSSLAPSMTKV